MKIKEVRAFILRQAGTARAERSGAHAGARRRAWTLDSEVAGPMSRFPRFKRSRATWRPTWPDVGCVVLAEGGQWGFGLARYGAPVASVINDHLGPLLAGEEAGATETLWDMMNRAASPYGAIGLASFAIAAIDLALWDLKGRALGRPVWDLLGGPARKEIPCYATGNDTDWHMELGFTATKLACPFGPVDGADGLARNAELVARTRDLIGPKVGLMLDCWMAMDVDYTVRLAETLRPFGLRWIEDYLWPEDMLGYAEVRKRLPWQMLASGEHWYSLNTFAQAIAGRTVDLFQPDIHWSGGLTACLKLAHMAEAAGIPVAMHAGMNTAYGQHLTYAMPNMPLGELFIGTDPGIPLEQVAGLPGTPVPVGGMLVPSDRPGFGLEIDLDWIERMRAG